MKELRVYFDSLTERQVHKFMELVCRLPPNYQTAINRCLRGRTQAMIAKELKLSQPRVSKMLCRGLEVIREVTEK